MTRPMDDCAECTGTRACVLHGGRSLLLSAVLAALAVCHPVPAAAEPPASAEMCSRAVHVEAGGVVPCTGDLVPTRVLGLMLGELRQLALVRDELELEKLRHGIDTRESAAVLAAERDARATCEASRTPPCRSAHRAWYESPWMGGAIGAVVGVGVAVAIVYAVR